MADSNPFKVKLIQQNNPGIKVIFDVTPDLSESRSVQYKMFDPVHMPGAIYMYQGTGSRIFQLSNVRFVSRTPEEAAFNLRDLQTLRTWCMPYFGKSGSTSGVNPDDVTSSNVITRGGLSNSIAGGAAAQTNQGIKDELLKRASGAAKKVSDLKIGPKDFDTAGDPPGTVASLGGILGAPPDVLLFSAYSATSGETGGMTKTEGLTHIRRIPVVITTLNITYPSDVDYIPASGGGSGGEGVPMPTVMSVEITLNETHSPDEYSNFSLEDFYNGRLEGF